MNLKFEQVRHVVAEDAVVARHSARISYGSRLRMAVAAADDEHGHVFDELLDLLANHDQAKVDACAIGW